MTYAQILQNYTKNVEFSTENWIYYLAQQLYSGKDELSCTRLQVWVGYIIACMSIHETCNSGTLLSLYTLSMRVNTFATPSSQPEKKKKILTIKIQPYCS